MKINILWLHMNDNNKQFLSQQLMWIAIYFTISLVISLLVPFPFSLIAIVGIVLLLSFYIRKRQLQRIGSFNYSIVGSKLLNYYCMSCGTKHRQIACPSCGSKMKKAEF